jgi:hypothetical protein
MSVNALTGAVLTVGIFMLGHLITAVWWASKITTLLDGINGSLKKVTQVTEDHAKTFFLKEEADRYIALRNQQMAALEKDLKHVQEEMHKCQLMCAERRECMGIPKKNHG